MVFWIGERLFPPWKRVFKMLKNENLRKGGGKMGIFNFANTKYQCWSAAPQFAELLPRRKSQWRIYSHSHFGGQISELSSAGGVLTLPGSGEGSAIVNRHNLAVLFCCFSHSWKPPRTTLYFTNAVFWRLKRYIFRLFIYLFAHSVWLEALQTWVNGKFIRLS